MQSVDNNLWGQRRGYRLSRTIKSVFLFGGIGLLVIMLVLLVVTLVKQHDLTKLKRYETTLVQEVAELDMLNGQKKLLENDQQQLDTRFKKVQKVTCISKNNPYNYLRSIEKIIPDRVVLKDFVFDHTKIKLEGLAYTVQEVTKFMRALSKSKLVKLPQLVALDRGKKHQDKQKELSEEHEGTIRFTINVTKT